MKIKFILPALLLIGNIVFAQQTSITLDKCLEMAKENWPNFKKTELYSTQIQNIDRELNKNYLPSLFLSASASYQTEVAGFPTSGAAASLFPELPKDNYNIELNLNQIIYDGGNISSLKDLKKASNELEQNKDEIENYQMLWNVQNLYLSALLVEQNTEVLERSDAELNENIKSLESAVANGLILESEYLNLRAEKLKLEKQIGESKSALAKLFQSLRLITGIAIDDNCQLEIPAFTDLKNQESPLLKSFEQQIKLNQASLRADTRGKLPTLALFAKGGYGRPGFDFINTQLHPYAILGLKFTWNFFDWGANSIKRENNQINIKKIQASKEAFLINNQIEIDKCNQDIGSVELQIKKDTEIIELRIKILQSAKSALKNGTITSNEYLNSFNELKNAEQVLQINKIKLIQLNLYKKHLKGTEY